MRDIKIMQDSFKCKTAQQILMHQSLDRIPDLKSQQIFKTLSFVKLGYSIKKCLQFLKGLLSAS
jgi:hypothetical protein